jgi:alpha-beta hydrolase superfamily lysophospholipase
VSLPSEHAVSRHIGASDATPLHYLEWPSAHDTTRATLVYLHGIASHAGWFVETAEVLNERGVHVFAPDRRGSGRSGGPRGHIASYEQALSDVHRLIEVINHEWSDIPLFLAGSSWAAKLALVYAVARPRDVAGLLLIGPGLTPRIGLPSGQRLQVLFGRIFAPTASLPIPLWPELYTQNKTYLDYIKADPLRILTATTRFFWETNRLDRQRDRAAEALRVPLLVQIGEEDAMMDVEATRRWFASVGSNDKTLTIYPGAKHTLDFEPDPRQYRSDLVTWILARSLVHSSVLIPPGECRAR